MVPMPKVVLYRRLETVKMLVDAGVCADAVPHLNSPLNNHTVNARTRGRMAGLLLSFKVRRK